MRGRGEIVTAWLVAMVLSLGVSPFAAMGEAQWELLACACVACSMDGWWGDGRCHLMRWIDGAENGEGSERRGWARCGE